MRRVVKIIASLVACLYPVIVFLCLVVYHMPTRIFSLCLFAFAGAIFLATDRHSGLNKLRSLLFPLFLLVAGLCLLLLHSDLVLQLYPLLVSTMLFFVFSGSLMGGSSIIWRFATLGDRHLLFHANQAAVKRYCRLVTKVWIGFFALNFTLSLVTIVANNTAWWALYNGVLSYILMGVLFGGEGMVRKMANARWEKTVLLSETQRDSRPDDMIVCYSGRWSDHKFLYWKDYVEDVAKVKVFVETSGKSRWILHSDDFWYFTVAFAALCQCHKTICLTANIALGYLDDLFDQDTAMLSDVETGRSTLIGKLLENPVPVDLRWNAIDARKTVLYLYTSGSTGKPKAVRHTLYEMELDYDFVMSMWGKEFHKRILISSVNPHHIFGFLFAALRPVTICVPFRRERIVQPEELQSQTDSPVTFISTPAFLKRCVEDPDLAGGAGLKDPLVIVSGGALQPEEAGEAEKVLGSWPIELYGSTETSGIAWRQTNKSLEWSPFFDVGFRKGEDGCLILNSPFIEDKRDFVTSDLVEIRPDGHFLLLGRKDSVVKIEEKRISLTEVEGRIMELGIAKDCTVVAFNDRRQYLAAVVVLNGKGHELLDPMNPAERLKYLRTALARWFEPIVIPRKWRFVAQIPQDSMGKKKRVEILALFK